MPKLRLDHFGAVGLNSSVEHTLLPPNVLTRMRNVVCEDNSVRSAPGQAKLFDIEGMEPIYSFVFTDPLASDPTLGQYIAVSDGTGVRIYDMTGAYTQVVADATWLEGYVSFTDLNGILIVNSASDGAFYWVPGDLVLTALPGWGVDWRCREMVSYRYGLFALGMLEDDTVGSSNSFPQKLRWSNSAEEGSIPTSWDATDLSKDAGDDILGETPGVIVGGVRSRGYLYVIKEDAIYQVRRVDGQYIYATERLQGTIGTRAQKGFCEMEGHIVVMTSSDVLLFDGQRQVSIADSRVTQTLRDDMDQQFFERSQVVFDQVRRKLYVCYVRINGRLTEALVYDPVSNTWAHKTLTNAYGMLFGYAKFRVSGDVWDDTTTATWDTLTNLTWNSGIYNPSEKQLLVLESDASGTYWLAMQYPPKNTGSDDAPVLCQVGRDGIRIDEQGHLVLIKGVWFESWARSPLETKPKVLLKIGTQDDIEGPIRWAQNRSGAPVDAFLVDLENDNYVDTRISGRYLCWEIQSRADTAWRLSGLVIDWEPAGER